MSNIFKEPEMQSKSHNYTYITSADSKEPDLQTKSHNYTYIAAADARDPDLQTKSHECTYIEATDSREPDLQTKSQNYTYISAADARDPDLQTKSHNNKPMDHDKSIPNNDQLSKKMSSMNFNNGRNDKKDDDKINSDEDDGIPDTSSELTEGGHLDLKFYHSPLW